MNFKNLNLEIKSNMNTLVKNIEKNITTFFNEYIKRVSEVHNIPVKDLEKLLDNVNVECVPIEKVAKSASAPTSAPTSTKAGNTCKYLFSKGVNKGQLCGTKTSGEYCSKHKAASNKESPCSEDKKRVSKPATKKSPPSSPTKNIILRRNKDIGNKLWHPDTQLVFKSTRDKTVIGKAIGNEIVALSEEDIENCKRMCFAFDDKYDISNIEKSEVDEPKTKVDIDKRLTMVRKQEEEEDLEDDD